MTHPSTPPVPPVAVVVTVEAPTATGLMAPMVLMQDRQQTVQVPQFDLTVEVIGDLPLQDKVQDLSRLLALRHQAAPSNFRRRHPPIILELVTLVARRPAKPRGRTWEAIRALTIRYHPEPKHVIVEYCIDFCDVDPRTGALHPRRQMVSYRAPEATVRKRVDKKLGELQRFAAPPPDGGR